jgi:hypothetical protein
MPSPNAVRLIERKSITFGRGWHDSKALTTRADTKVPLNRAPQQLKAYGTQNISLRA